MKAIQTSLVALVFVVSPTVSLCQSLFQRPVTYTSGGTGSMAVAVADVNGDGIPDLVTANQNGTNGEGLVGVLIGYGNGTFQPVVTYDSGGTNAWSVAVADLNSDGKPDIVVMNTHSSSSVGVLLGKGDGTFLPVKTYAASGYSIAVADVNGDGKLDLITGALQVLLGNGDGTFQPAVAYGTLGQDAIVADVNGDGKLDIVATIGASGIGVLLGNGDGTFQKTVNYSTGGIQSYSVAVGDLNGDGKPDIVATNYCPTGACTADGTVAVLLGNGDGTFQSAVTYDAGGKFTQTVALADVNGDSKLDVVVGSACLPNTKGQCIFHGAVSILLGHGDGTLGSSSPISTPGAVEFLTLADINGGKPDIVAANGGASVMALFGERVSTTTAMNASPNPSLVNQPVTISATITPSSGRDPGGQTINFYDGTVLLGTGITTAGTATFTTSFSTAGKHRLRAALQRSSAFLASVNHTYETINP